jgi:hypothetical protein
LILLKRRVTLAFPLGMRNGIEVSGLRLTGEKVREPKD